MDWVRDLPDDQLALLGCGGALLASAFIMTLSYYIGRQRTVGTAGAPLAGPRVGQSLPVASTPHSPAQPVTKSRNKAA